jgi:four helix bundle protein
MGRNHHNLLVYKKAYAFTLECYAVSDHLEDTQMRSQLRRALISVPLNIAEGCGSRSQKVLRNHLSYAYGSCKEVEVLLDLCKDLVYLDDSLCFTLLELLDEVKKMLYGFLAKVEQDINQGKNAFTYA